MSLVLKILQSTGMGSETDSILDAEERGYFLDEDLQAAEDAINGLVTNGWSYDIISLAIMTRDFISENNILAVAHCVALMHELTLEK